MGGGQEWTRREREGERESVCVYVCVKEAARRKQRKSVSINNIS